MNLALQTYKEKGYFVAKSILPKPDVNQVLRDVHRILAQQLLRLGITPVGCETYEAFHQDMVVLKKADVKCYLASLRLCANLYSVFALVMNDSVKKMAHDFGIALPVFQTTPVLHVMSHALRFEDGYFGVGAHQDWPALQGGLDTLTTWIPLVPVPASNFPLQIIPGSHKLGFAKSVETQHYHEVDRSLYRDEDFDSVEAEPGDVIFMSSFSIHRSGLKGGDDVRISISARYENAAETTFVERGYPYTQKRVVERTLITPNFPTRDQVLKIFE